ncbi:MAG: hypothetical protein AAF487_10960, partial [Bacteroidota bacterium]
MQVKSNFSALLAMLFLSLSIFGQEPAVFYEEDLPFKTAHELYDKEKYAAAMKLFDEVAVRQPKTEITAQAEYMAAQCAIHLFHRDAEVRLLNFVDDNPHSPHVKTAISNPPTTGPALRVQPRTTHYW